MLNTVFSVYVLHWSLFQQFRYYASDFNEIYAGTSYGLIEPFPFFFSKS